MNKNELINRVLKSIELPNKKQESKKLFFFFGLPGSGKTTLAHKLKTLIPAVYLSSDQIAISNELEHTNNYHLTFEVINELTEQFLSDGYSVILDSNSDRYIIRDQLYKIASRNLATPICFYVKTQFNTVLDRQKIRQNSMDTLKENNLFYIEPSEMKRYDQELELPLKKEPVITIDGEEDLDEQLSHYKRIII